MLQKQEQKQFQDLSMKAHIVKDQQVRSFRNLKNASLIYFVKLIIIVNNNSLTECVVQILQI